MNQILRIALILFFVEITTSSRILYKTDTPESYTPPSTYNQTFVGVLTQPLGLTDQIKSPPNMNLSHNAESYHKYTEDTGATSLVIPYDMPWDRMKEILDQLQGLVLPGGHAAFNIDDKVTYYGQQILNIYDYAISRNEKERPFFLFGICLGFQELIRAATINDLDVIQSGFDDHVPHSVEFQPLDFFSRSKVLSRGNIWEYARVFKQQIVYYSHTHGITPDHFKKYPELVGNYNVLGTSKDPKNLEFVTIIEHKKYPFFGTQFHPEKSQFEKRASTVENLHRDYKNLNVTSSLIRQMIDYIRELKAISISDLDAQKTFLNNYLYYNFMPYRLSTYFEKQVVANDMSQCKSKEDCAANMYSAKAQDEIYDLYKMYRDEHLNL